MTTLFALQGMHTSDQKSACNPNLPPGSQDTPESFASVLNCVASRVRAASFLIWDLQQVYV